MCHCFSLCCHRQHSFLPSPQARSRQSLPVCVGHVRWGMLAPPVLKVSAVCGPRVTSAQVDCAPGVSPVQSEDAALALGELWGPRAALISACDSWCPGRAALGF